MYINAVSNQFERAMISALVITYLVVWVLAVIFGLVLSFTSLIPGFIHEYRTAAGLNLVLFAITLLLLFSSVCKTERVLRMMIWYCCACVCSFGTRALC